MKILVIALKVLGILLLLAVLMAGAFAGGIGTGIYYTLTPAGTFKPVRIDVAEGEPAAVVADELEKQGVIHSALLFRAALKFSGAETSIKPGSYLVDPQNNMMEILNQLEKGNFKLRLITIPEGLTVKEVARTLEKNGVAKAKDVMRASEEKVYKVNNKKLDSLEGYLLPETYDFPEEYCPGDMLEAMIKSFNKNVLPIYERRKDKLPHKLSLHQVVTLASMVEREAQVPSERPKIARVYYNRLNRGMKMECDATIQYALGKPKEILKYSDLKIKSPYNTYMYKGLPPGPIASPGIDCIRAVLNPEKHEYFFYVRNDVKDDGSHVFSRTFSEHNAAIRNYQR